MKTNRHEITVIFQCPFCGAGHEVEVNEDDYFDWDEGTLAQDAFPYLTATEREQFISNLCPACQAQIFDEGE